MNKALLLYILFQILFITVLPAYSGKKAILMVNKEAQTDSFTYNIVTDFNNWIYSEISEGKIRLWDSPRKGAEVTIDNLTSIENSSGIKFTNLENFFIYEVWNTQKTGSSFNIIGFGFSTENKSGTSINFGYIDFNEIVHQLKLATVSTSINGSYCRTFYEVFMNKSFVWDLIFFDIKPILSGDPKKAEKEYIKGLKIKNNAFGPDKTNLNKMKTTDCKLVEYMIDNFDYDNNTEKIISLLETYFRNDKEALVKFGGDQVVVYFSKTKLIITECYMRELWILNGQNIQRQVLDVTPKSINFLFQPMTPADLEDSFFSIDSMPILDYLLAKDFKYYIQKINNIEVDKELTTQYTDALNNKKWSQLPASVPKKKNETE